MKSNLAENSLQQLSEFIASNLALNFPRERWVDLERNITAASKDFGYDNLEAFIHFITSSPLTQENAEVLAANLTIGETYFWREPQTFEALEKIILPELVHNSQKGKKRIRIWSAGCSTGEESYSIAIALKRTIPFIKDWNITILATDINTLSLRKAEIGEYGQWSFRGTPSWLKEKYFVQKPNNKFEIIPEIKSMVKFEYLNLAEDIYPSSLNDTNAMDIIFCRNVLMYFSQERFRQVALGFYNSLVKEGYLLVSASELSLQNFPDFTPVNVKGMVLYRKTSKKIKDTPQISISETIPESIILQLIPELKNIENTKPKPLEVEKEEIKIIEIPIQVDTPYETSLKFYSLGNYEKVIETLQGDKLTANEQLLLIRAYANMGKLTEAIEACEKGSSLNKSNPSLHYLCATILLENNQFDEAITSLKRAIYLDSNFVLAYYSLGNIYKQLGNAKAAKKNYEVTISILNKSNPEDFIFESEGLTVGRFKEIVNASLKVSA